MTSSLPIEKQWMSKPQLVTTSTAAGPRTWQSESAHSMSSHGQVEVLLRVWSQ